MLRERSRRLPHRADRPQREVTQLTSNGSLYGPQQSRFARYLERRELRRPDSVAREHRERLLSGLRGRVLELGCGDGRAFELYPDGVEQVVAVEPDPVARAAAAERARVAALGGCRTTRDTLAAIRDAGFRVGDIEHGFHSSSWLTLTSAPYVIGTARV